MNSTSITVLSVVGVLVIAAGAMAVNADTLSSIAPGTIGRATEVLVPPRTDAPDPAATIAPTAMPTFAPAPGDDTDDEDVDGDSADDGDSHDDDATDDSHDDSDDDD